MRGQDSKVSIRNQRIASNTLMLFVRILVLTLANLYIVRILLDRLGTEDYGIFNTIVGVITASSFVSGTLDIAFQRFYSYAIGKGDKSSPEEIYSSSINIVIILSAIILASMIPIGEWFVNSKMNMPADRVHAASIGFHFALWSFVFSILQIPFTSVIIAHENMRLYTIVSTFDCVLRLLAALLIGCFTVDKLSFYCLGIFVCSLLVFLLYWLCSIRLYAECKYRFSFNFKLLKKLLQFSGWTTYGATARVAMIQGSTVIINLFFGPLANAAFAVAMQINNALSTLTNCMVMALRPPMIKAYAEGATDYLDHVFMMSNKFIFYALLLVATPLILEMDNILSWWIGNSISHQMIVYSKMVIIYVTIMALSNPVTIIIHATGNVAKYHFVVETIMLMCLPLTWLFFKKGFPSEYVFLCMIGVTIVAHIFRLMCIKESYASFSLGCYIRTFCLPAILISAVCFGSTIVVHEFIHNPLLRLLCVSLTSCAFVGTLSFVVGLNSKERDLCLSMIGNVSFIKRWKR